MYEVSGVQKVKVFCFDSFTLLSCMLLVLYHPPDPGVVFASQVVLCYGYPSSLPHAPSFRRFHALPTLQWVILVPPTKTSLTEDETRWSKALESVRKYVECFFVILKGCFQALKLPHPYRKNENVDYMCFTCCTLHNMLHAFDGVKVVLEADVEWGGNKGLHDMWDAGPLTNDSTDGRSDVEKVVEVDSGHVELKNEMIAHFTYRKNNNDIVWPRR